MRYNYKKSLVIACVLLGMAEQQALGAGGLDLSLHLNTRYDENIDRAPVNGRHDTVNGLGIGFDYFAQRPRVSADVRANGTYYHYMDSTFDDELQGAVAATVAFQVVPDRIQWLVQESYGPLLENPLAADRPDNWSYDSYFTTGPDLTFGAGSRTRFVTSLRYGRSDYESDEPSNHYYFADLALVRAAGLRSELSLHVNGRTTTYEDTASLALAVNPDFDIYEGFARAKRDTARGGLSLDVGATQVHQLGDSSSTPLVRLKWDHRLSAHFAFVASVGSHYAESLERLRRLQGETDGIDTPRNDVAVLSTALRERYADLIMEITGARTTLSLSGRYSSVRYDLEDALARQKYQDLGAELSRRITPTFTATLRGIYSERDFDSANRNDTDMRVGAWLEWRAGRTITWELRGERLKRTSNDPTQEYESNIATIEVTYRPYQRRRAEEPTLFDRPTVR